MQMLKNLTINQNKLIILAGDLNMFSELSCVKSVQITSFFWIVFSSIQSEYRKIWTRKNSVFGNFLRSGYRKLR